MAFDSIFASVSGELQFVAASIDNPRKLKDDAAAANYEPPLYVWDPQGISETEDIPYAGGQSNPKSFAMDAHSWDIGCWAATREGCEKMRLALITVMKQNLVGQNFRINASQWAYSDWARVGFILLVSVTFYAPQYAIEIPTTSGLGIQRTT
jgi:hypothetical protein